ncbi:MAG: hypothetical protein FJZ01_03780 [Candidatus Sericytochromatia bacterium]|nr:hypothetical protein [Candidatus Tanganyikabacteria bacterium]
MATDGGVKAAGLLSSMKGKLGSVAGKLGNGLGRLADSKAAGWATDKVRSLTVNDQVIRGWQDVYKGIRTLEGHTKIIRTVRVVRDPGALGRGAGTAGRVARGAGTAGKATGNAGKVVDIASKAGKAAKATGKAAKGATTAGNFAKGARSVASGAARKGDVLLREGTKVAGSVKKIKVPGGFREVTRVDVTKAELVGKGAKLAKSAGKGSRIAEAAKAGKVVRAGEAGLKVVKGTKFKLGGGEIARGAKGAGKGAAGAGGSGGSGAAHGLNAAKSGAAARGARGAGKAAKGAKGAGSAAKGAKGAGSAAKGAKLVRTAKGAKSLKGSAGAAKGSRAGARVSETTTTITKGAKGFKKPFGIQAIKAGFKNIFQGAMKAAKVSAVVNLVISVLSNGYGVLSGQIGLPEAMGGIARDTATGFFAGGAAAVFSGGVLAVAGAFGLTAGLPVFLVGLAASLIGYTIADALFSAIIGDKIKAGVQRLFGG